MERLLLRAAKGVFLLLLGSQSVLAGSAQQQETRSVAGSALAQTQSSTSKVTSRESTVTFRDGRLTVSAKGCPLGQLLDEISGKAEVAVITTGDVGTQPISIQFKNLSLDTGLRQILENYDVFFYFAADKKLPAALKVVWVYPKGKARGLEPVPPEKWASTKELERMLTDPDPEVRGRTIETLVERKHQAALDAVLNSLTDSDDQVRTRALYGAAKAGVQVPEGVLNNLVVSDASPDVRFLALQALADSPKARSAAEGALSDPSEPVRHAAQEILARLDSADQSQAPSQTPQAQPAPNQN
jgi:HEAT repeat protein